MRIKEGKKCPIPKKEKKQITKDLLTYKENKKKKLVVQNWKLQTIEWN